MNNVGKLLSCRISFLLSPSINGELDLYLEKGEEYGWVMMCSCFSRWISCEDTLRRMMLLGRGDGATVWLVGEASHGLLRLNRQSVIGEKETRWLEEGDG
ncbi:hypothetical protein NC652_022517 [Populus alba x Populus x berolinensis]|nr:hypothetical protein NC652_022433 [Populus alba x Populus x berolinensis]KAJ6904522.1 hypothetical protein NC652_022517 [Populus alba x Populus x berolinensis]